LERRRVGVEWENRGEPRLSNQDRLSKPLSSRIWSTQSLAAPVAAARKHWPGSSPPRIRVNSILPGHTDTPWGKFEGELGEKLIAGRHPVALESPTVVETLAGLEGAWEKRQKA